MILEIQDIINSVSVPALIKDEFIKAGTFAKTRNGDAQVCVGGFSVVFPVEVNGTKWAFRCWHNTLDDSAQGRIRLLSSELQKSKLPYFIDFTYEDSGIFVNGRSFPTTRMKWINGRDLKDYICHYKNDRGKLFKLAGDFFKMTQDLHRMNIAHGDLQHENIIVSPYGKLYLIDYDSMYVPALSVNAKNTTNGKDGYQHPAREHCVYASKKLDYFSEAVILISILAIAYNPTLVDKYHLDDSDSLLFRKSDFQQFSQKPVYKDIVALEEPFDVLLKVMSFYLKQSNIDTLDPIEITINKVCPTNVISLSEFICSAECALREKEEDKADWCNAKKLNTKESYKSYLSKHPKGKYREQARERLKSIRNKKLSHFFIIFDVVIAIYILIRIFLTCFSPGQKSMPKPKPAIPGPNVTIKVSFSPAEIKQLEDTTEILIVGMETAKSISDTIPKKSILQVESNLDRLDKAKSAKYSKLKRRYDAL